MRICIDVDGTICQNRQVGQSYLQVMPILGAVESIQQMKAKGHYIILYTSRGMQTYNNNIGKIVAENAKHLIEWLHIYKIPFDEIVFGKPLADLYIDDKAKKFTLWKDMINEI